MAAAGRELEGDDLDLWAFRDEVAPADIVMLGTAVDVQGCR